jgi:hypothetical protein
MAGRWTKSHLGLGTAEYWRQAHAVGFEMARDRIGLIVQPLKFLAVIGALCAAFVGLPLHNRQKHVEIGQLVAPQPTQPSGRELFVQTEEDLLCAKYDLSIVTSDPQFPVRTSYGQITARSADIINTQSYLRVLLSEWNLYPAKLVKRTTLRRIVLCEDLSYGGQLRAAIPDFEHRDLYLDVARGAYDDLYRRGVLHHEFFHMIDYCNGTLGCDGRWSALLPKGTKYGTGGKKAQNDPFASLITTNLPGFLNTYCKTSVEEDKAEVFANMIVRAFQVEELANKDPIIRRKTHQMKEFLKDFCSEMDDRFWRRASELNVRIK